MPRDTSAVEGAGETTTVIRVSAEAASEPFSRPWHERQKLVASVCDRLAGNLDGSLRAARELCASLNSGSPGGTGAGTGNAA